MLFVDNAAITDPRVNLALEEYLLLHANTDEPLLLFYINEPSVIIGRNQNTLEEINYDYIQAQQVHVVRRLSGGGAVYHDLGNLNFSFITRYEEGSLQNFEKFTRPVVNVLNGMGIAAQLGGRNDILVDGRKISGNAQYHFKRRMFSHGTLLFNTNLEHVVAALTPDPTKITSKGLKSVRSRVANITEFLDAGMDIQTFKHRLLQGIFGCDAAFPVYALAPADWENVHTLTAQRYASWDWNYGKSPKFNVHKSQRFAIGMVDVRIDVQNGKVADCKIYGDFLGNGDIVTIENCLIGVNYEPLALAAALGDLNVAPYFGGLSQEEFLTLLF